MKKDFRRLIIALLVMIGTAIPLHHVLSYALDDVVQVNGIVDNEIYDKVCKAQGIIDGLAAVQNGYIKELVKATIEDFKEAAVNYAIQLILCNIIPDKTITGSILGIGGSVTFKSPNCPMEIWSANASLVKQQALRNLKSNFEARCLGREMFNQVGRDITRILQENGPDGGQAYVSDWTQLPAVEDARAINRFNAILVNTPICPYFRDRVYAYFSVPQNYINDPPPIDKSGFKVDGGDPFTLRGACSAPADLTPRTLDADFHNKGGFDALKLLMRPENNFDDFVRMAQEELAKQRETVVQGATNEAIAGSGFRGLYSTCVRQDSAGHCLQQTVTQPAGAVNSIVHVRQQGEIDWITNSQTANSMTGDIRQRIISGLLDIGSTVLDIPIEFDASTKELERIGNSTPTPGAPDDPNSPDNLACTGGNPLCFCVKNNPEFQTIRNWVADATRAAIIAHPELVTSDGTSVLPGQNVNFLIAICETSFGGTLGCRPNAGSDDEVVIDTGTMTISVDVITSDNVIRIPGQTIAACQPGAQ